MVFNYSILLFLWIFLALYNFDYFISYLYSIKNTANIKMLEVFCSYVIICYQIFIMFVS